MRLEVLFGQGPWPTFLRPLYEKPTYCVKWPLPEGWDDSRLEATLFHQSLEATRPRKEPPDYAAIHQQLQKPHVTLQLLWQEYQETNPAAIATAVSVSCTSAGANMWYRAGKLRRGIQPA